MPWLRCSWKLKEFRPQQPSDRYRHLQIGGGGSQIPGGQARWAGWSQKGTRWSLTKRLSEVGLSPGMLGSLGVLGSILGKHAI